MSLNHVHCLGLCLLRRKVPLPSFYPRVSCGHRRSHRRRTGKTKGVRAKTCRRRGKLTICLLYIRVAFLKLFIYNLNRNCYLHLYKIKILHVGAHAPEGVPKGYYYYYRIGIAYQPLPPLFIYAGTFKWCDLHHRGNFV